MGVSLAHDADADRLAADADGDDGADDVRAHVDRVEVAGGPEGGWRGQDEDAPGGVGVVDAEVAADLEELGEDGVSVGRGAQLDAARAEGGVGDAAPALRLDEPAEDDDADGGEPFDHGASAGPGARAPGSCGR